MTRDPGVDVPTLLREADGLVDGGSHDRALDLYDRALSIREAPGIMCRKARCLAKMGRDQEALDLCKAAYNKNMMDPAIPYRAANISSKMGLDKEAAEWYFKTQNLKPGDPKILTGLAKFHSKLGDHEMSANFYMQSYKIQKNTSILHEMANEFLDAGDLITAKRFCNMALDVNAVDRQVKKLNLDITNRIKYPCSKMEAVANFLSIPDTNWWINHYRVKKKRPMTDNELRTDTDSMIDDVKYGRLRIFKVIRSEFDLIVNNMINTEEDGRRSTYQSKALDAFHAICGKMVIDERPIEERSPDMYKRANLVYREIWRDKSDNAKIAKNKWARIKSRIKPNAWNKMPRIKKDELISKGPPQKTNDHRILAEAGSLVTVDGGRKVEIITGDHDFIPFSRWIWRRFDVCIRESYDGRLK